jgi:predicted RNA-binding protein with PUA-like domain
MAKKYWLMKSEPEVFSIIDLEREGRTLWEGVRNYQARNFMMNDMSIGDEVLFYHSNAEPPGVAGIATVSGKAVHDPTDKEKKPTWYCVEVKFVRKFASVLPLGELKKNKKLAKMPLLQRGQRLSVQPVSPAEFKEVLEMAK